MEFKLRALATGRQGFAPVSTGCAEHRGPGRKTGTGTGGCAQAEAGQLSEAGLPVQSSFCCSLWPPSQSVSVKKESLERDRAAPCPAQPGARAWDGASEDLRQAAASPTATLLLPPAAGHADAL